MWSRKSKTILCPVNLKIKGFSVNFLNLLHFMSTFEFGKLRMFFIWFVLTENHRLCWEKEKKKWMVKITAKPWSKGGFRLSSPKHVFYLTSTYFTSEICFQNARIFTSSKGLIMDFDILRLYLYQGITLR